MTVIAMSRTEIDRMSVLQDLAASRIKMTEAASLMRLGQGAKFWLRVMNELKNRGVEDILLAVVDGLLQPQAENLLAAIRADAQGDMDRLVADHAFVADLDADRIEKDKRVNRIERPLLPGGDLVQHGIRDRADQIGRHLDPVKLLQVPRDLPGAHAARIHRHDLLVEPRKAALIFGISCGSKLASRSRGTSSSSLPVSVITVLRP